MHPYLSKLNMQEHPRTINIQIKLNSHKKIYIFLLPVDCSLKGTLYGFQGQTSNTYIRYSVFNPLTKHTNQHVFKQHGQMATECNMILL